MTTEDPYDVCRRIKRYHEKNGYAPTGKMVDVSPESAESLVRNGVIVVFANYEGGPKIYLALTDKGRRMADRDR